MAIKRSKIDIRGKTPTLFNPLPSTSWKEIKDLVVDNRVVSRAFPSNAEEPVFTLKWQFRTEHEEDLSQYTEEFVLHPGDTLELKNIHEVNACLRDLQSEGVVVLPPAPDPDSAGYEKAAEAWETKKHEAVIRGIERAIENLRQYGSGRLEKIQQDNNYNDEAMKRYAGNRHAPLTVNAAKEHFLQEYLDEVRSQ